jgi:hypothetical protein
MLTNKTDLLDPLSTIIKLRIYSYKPTGTKISVQFNKISIQENNIPMLQTALRTWMRDTKNDLNILSNPVVYACEIYLNGENRDKYMSLFKDASLAFNKLKETYSGTDIIFTIDNIQNNMNMFIENKDHDIGDTIQTANNISSTIRSTIYESIGKIWTENRLTILFNYLNELESYGTDEELVFILAGLASFMDYMDFCSFSEIRNL